VKAYYVPTFEGDMIADTHSGIEQGDTVFVETASRERFPMGAPTSSNKPRDTGGETSCWSSTGTATMPQ
jgi:hypothetical protein